jgi:hypothetical protein
MSDVKAKYVEALKRRRPMGAMCDDKDQNNDGDQAGMPIDGTAPDVKDKPEAEMGMDLGMMDSQGAGDNGADTGMDSGAMDIGELLKNIGPLAKLIELMKGLKMGNGGNEE